jgi:outer membrane protein OmpA-like peptidoglycan-associated protein
MKVSEYQLTDSHEALLDGRQQRNWLLVGLLISLILHIALCAYFYRAKFSAVSDLTVAPPEPPTFKVRNVDLKSLEQMAQDQTNPAAKPEPEKTDTQQPDEKKSFDQLLQDVHASAALPDDTRDVLPEKPLVEQPNATSVLNEIEQSTAQVLSQNPNAQREQTMLTDAANSGRPQPAINGTELATSTTIKRPNVFTNSPADSAGPTRNRAPGFSDIDQLLSQKGPLGSGTKLRMPDDQLFSYDSADLQPGSIEQLQKLGTLIKRNAKATFSVEGYTDSLGSFEYNVDLSQRRADSVKRYLVDVMGINPAQIQTHGYGATKFLVPPHLPAPATGTPEEQSEIERQKPNRRVVIVVKTNDAPPASATIQAKPKAKKASPDND